MTLSMGDFAGGKACFAAGLFQVLYIHAPDLASNHALNQ
jgi:hypothetical protein